MGNCHARKRQLQAVATPARLSTPAKDFGKEIPRQGREVLCQVCCESGDKTVIPAAKVTSSCSGMRAICESCLAHYLQEQIEGKGDIDNLTCHCASKNGSQGKCNVKLGFSDVEKHASSRVFARYDEALTRRLLEREEEFCWCAAGCGSGQLHASKDQYPVMHCHACAARTCFTHHCRWHEGRSCRQYDTDARKSEEVGLLQLLEKSNRIKRCPNCNHGVEKNKGCNHMTCRCKHEFCWLCLSPYKGPQGIQTIGNSAHKRTCRDYRPNGS